MTNCMICSKPLPKIRISRKLNTCSKKCNEIKRYYLAKNSKEPSHALINQRRKAIKILTVCPPCSPQDMWDDWQMLNRNFIHKNGLGNVFCDDCTPEFQNKMKLQGKCVCDFYPVSIDTKDDLDHPEWVNVR